MDGRTRAWEERREAGLEDDAEGVRKSDVPTFVVDEGGSGNDWAPVGDDQATADTKAEPSSRPDMSPPPPPPLSAKMPPPPRLNPNAKRKLESALMPPPPTPASTLRVPPTLSSTRRPPPSTAAALRVPPSASLAPPSSSLSASTLAPSTRPSKKVLLDPGHSPLDWAHLTANPPTAKFLRGADVPPQLIRVPPSALKWHSGRKGKDAWGVWQGKVYNLTPYMKFHPGGVEELMRAAGKVGDGERLFKEVHPWVSWENMLGECLVGILVSENEVGTEEGNRLEEMD